MGDGTSRPSPEHKTGALKEVPETPKNTTPGQPCERFWLWGLPEGRKSGLDLSPAGGQLPAGSIHLRAPVCSMPGGREYRHGVHLALPTGIPRGVPRGSAGVEVRL